MLILGVVFTTACSKKVSNTSVIFTVNEKEVTLKDMMYYIYPMEAEGNYYEQMSQEYFKTSYWEMEAEEGVTMREYTKKIILENAIMYEVLYLEAQKLGYSLTEDEIKTAKDNAASIMSGMDESVLKLTGFTEELLSQIEQKLQLGKKYSDEIMSGVEVDEDAIADTISYEEYRQYNTENLFVSTTYYDDDGTLESLSEKEIQEMKDIIKDAFTQVKEGKSFEDLEGENDLLLFSELNFVKGDGSVDSKYQEAALALANGQMTDSIIEGEEGFYIIKMIDDNSKESYEAEIENAIMLEEDKKFMEVYDKMAENYKTEINNSNWDPLVVGEITIPKNSSVTINE